MFRDDQQAILSAKIGEVGVQGHRSKPWKGCMHDKGTVYASHDLIYWVLKANGTKCSENIRGLVGFIQQMKSTNGPSGRGNSVLRNPGMMDGRIDHRCQVWSKVFPNDSWEPVWSQCLWDRQAKETLLQISLSKGQSSQCTGLQVECGISKQIIEMGHQ